MKYMVNKHILQGRIYRWLFLFQEFSLKVIVKPGKLNVGPDHLYQLELAEGGRVDDDQLPNAYLFHIEAIPSSMLDIALFLTTGATPNGYSAT